MKAKDTRPSVLLDLDNTILDFDTAERHALSRALTALGVAFDDETLRLYHRLNMQHWEMLEDGLITREQVLTMRFEALFRALGVEGDAFCTQELYESLLSEGHWFMPGAEELLRELQDGCRLFLCSNGSQQVQDGRIASAGIAPYFERIFVSELMGANKPERRYFELCFREIPDFDPLRALMVGDSLTSDIRGGLNAGLKTCWYNPTRRKNPGPIRPDFEIAELSALKGLLRRLFG